MISRQPIFEILAELDDILLLGPTPYGERRRDLAISLTLTAADELAADAKKAESGWRLNGSKVEEVVAYTDRVGARWKMPVTRRIAGAPVLERSVTFQVSPVENFDTSASGANCPRGIV